MQYYTTYFYKFTSNIDRRRVMEFAAQNRDRADITIRQIVNEAVENKLKILNGIILTERSRSSNEKSFNDMSITIIEYSESHFFAVITVNHKKYSENDVKFLFRSITINTDPTYLNTGISEKETLDYWNDVIRSFSLAGKRRFKEDMKREMDIAFPLELENSERFTEILSENPERAKVYLAAAVSKIMCMINKSSGLVFEDIHEAGKLSKIPVRVDESVSSKSGRDRLYKFFSVAESKDFISFDTLSQKTHTDLNQVGLFAQSFVHEKSYSEFFKKMKVDTLYRVEPLSPGNVPLFVTYRMHEEDKLIRYEYDPGFLNGVSIEGFHEAVCALVDFFLSDADVEPDVSKLLYKKNDLEEKLREFKIRSLAALPLFLDYSQKDLTRVVEKFDMKQAYSQQCIVPSGEKCERLFLIVKGMVEVSGIDYDGIVRPLCFLKERESFGLESLCTDPVSKVMYTAYSAQCVYMSISAEDMMDEIKEHPTMVKDLLETQTNMLNKFQKLWMMS